MCKLLGGYGLPGKGHWGMGSGPGAARWGLIGGTVSHLQPAKTSVEPQVYFAE